MKSVAIVVIAISLAISCARSRPTAASREVADVKARFPECAAWVATNRVVLTQLASELQAQRSFHRIIWSRPPEYFTVILRGGRVLQGALNTNDWPPEEKAEVEHWVTRLKTAGCRGGFDDQGTNWAIRLFLDVNAYVAIPAASNSRLVEEYRAWSVKGYDARGDACTNLPGGWYLCSERR